MMGLSKTDVDRELCRLCGLADGVNLDIFDEKNDYQMKIHALLPIAVYEYDPLPNKICHRCVFKLDGFYEFRAICVKTEERLKRQLSWVPSDGSNKNNSSNGPLVDIANFDQSSLEEISSDDWLPSQGAVAPDGDDDVLVVEVVSPATGDEKGVQNSKETSSVPCESGVPEELREDSNNGGKVKRCQKRKHKQKQQQQTQKDAASARAKPKKVVTQSYDVLKSILSNKDTSKATQEDAAPNRVESNAGRKKAPLPNGSCPSGCRKRQPATPRPRPEQPSPATNGESRTNANKSSRVEAPPELGVKTQVDGRPTTVSGESVGKSKQRTKILVTHVPGVCDIYTCETCERMFTTREKAYSHECESDTESNKSDGDQVEILDEVNVQEDSGPPYTCCICGLSFTRHAPLVTHTRAHSLVSSDSDASGDERIGGGRRRKGGHRASAPRKTVRLSEPVSIPSVVV